MKCFLKLGRKVIFKALTVTMVVGLVMVFMGGWAFAQEKSVTQEILDIMLESHQISQDRYDALLKRAEAEKLAAAQKIAEAQRIAEAQKAAAQPAVPSAGTHGVPTSAEATNLSASWRNGLRLSNEDKSFDVHVGGRLQWDFADADPSKSLINWSHGAFAPTGTTFSETKVNGWGDQVRRARLLIDGTVYKDFEFSDQIEFAPSYTATTVLKSATLSPTGKLTTTTTSLTTGPAVTFADVWAGAKDVPYLGRIRVGQMYEPIGLEQQRSDNFRTFLETSIATTALIPGRNTGLLVENTYCNNRLGWQAGYFFQQQAALSSNGVPLDTTGDLFSPQVDATNAVARVTALPWYENNGEHLLHVGLGYEHKFRSFEPTTQAFTGQLNPGTLDFKSSPEANMFSALVDTGSFMAKGVDTLDPELALVYGPFALQAEVPLAWATNVRDTTGDYLGASHNASFSGWYVEGSYFLTGEHRLYNTTATTSQYQSTFGRIYPISDFNPRYGGTGAWELCFRVSNVDLNDAAAGFNGGNETDFTAGINWYLNADFLVKLNYIYATVGAHPNGYGNLTTSASDNIFESRFQVAF
ncbi:MAG: porin [Syntrophobacteraceae bacterium]